MLLKKIQSVQKCNGGKMLGDFIITDKSLGKGAFGEVFEGKNKNTNALVAVKTVSCDRSQLGEFETMLQTMPAHSPFILNLHDAFLYEQENKLYLIFDKYEGSLKNFIDLRVKNISSQLKNRTLPEKEALEIFCQIAEGCITLWRNDITHRDIKPDNILFRLDKKLNKNVFVIADFGLSKKQMYSLESGKGTPQYMAPEIIKGEHYDYKVDVWSLGVTLHEFLFGPLLTACSDQSGFSVMNQIIELKYKLSKEQEKIISSKTAQLLKDMIKCNPNERLTKENLDIRIKEFAEYEFVRVVMNSFKFEGKITKEESKEGEMGKEKESMLRYAEGLEKNAVETMRKGYYEKYRDMIKEAMDIYLNILGETAEETRRIMFQYAQGLQATKDYGKAKEFGEKAVMLYEKYSKVEDPNVGAAYGALGAVCREIGDYLTAKKYQEKAVNVYVKINGECHRNTAAAINNLAGTLQKLGNLGAAKEAYLRAMNIKIKLFGKDHFETAYNYYSLSVLLCDMKDHQEALKYCKMAKTIWEKHYGPNHDKTKDAEKREARISTAMKKSQKQVIKCCIIQSFKQNQICNVIEKIESTIAKI